MFENDDKKIYSIFDDLCIHLVSQDIVKIVYGFFQCRAMVCDGREMIQCRCFATTKRARCAICGFGMDESMMLCDEHKNIAEIHITH